MTLCHLAVLPIRTHKITLLTYTSVPVVNYFFCGALNRRTMVTCKDLFCRLLGSRRFLSGLHKSDVCSVSRLLVNMHMETELSLVDGHFCQHSHL